ncbi:hypothetical protein CBL_00264 [Carabus blaptoides fortunei]
MCERAKGQSRERIYSQVLYTFCDLCSDLPKFVIFLLIHHRFTYCNHRSRWR